MDKKRLKKSAISLGRDLFLAFVVVVVIMLILYAYCRVWPPMVVVESGSMEHSQSRSYVGVIDTGDMIFVKKIRQRSNLVTYVEGEAIDYSRYGGFGDVVIYRPNGDGNRTPIIHRLVVWLEINDTHVMPLTDGNVDYENYTFDIPSLGMFDSRDMVTLDDYGYDSRVITFDLGDIMQEYEINDVPPHDGFVTLGDANLGIDQINYMPVKVEWIVGKAVGELPWFGLIKLGLFGGGGGAHKNSWVNLFITITLLLCIPLFLDFGLPFVKRKLSKFKEKRGDSVVRDEVSGEDRGGQEESERHDESELPKGGAGSKQGEEPPEKDARGEPDTEPSAKL